MKPSWGIGIVVAVLVSIAVGLLGLVSLSGFVSLVLVLIGLWTIVSAFAFVERKDRTFYAGWGIVITGLSLGYVIPLQYALALILLAVVVLILVTVFFGKAPKLYTAATSPPSPAGETPAASAI
ncbi:MAG: hypothetical protein KGI38_08725 [Thaumarchaeota archaeon]|nr:hypothetical protein [Nitrososphaerota archaeon]